jgi:two-component system, NtrC family, response regulator
MKRSKILVIDPDVAIHKGLEVELRDEFDMLSTDSPSAGARLCLDWQPDVTLLELCLPPELMQPDEGFNFLRNIRRNGFLGKVIVFTRLLERTHAIRAVSLGAHDVLTKPVDFEMLKWIIKRATVLHDLETDMNQVEDIEGFGGMIGTSKTIRDSFAAIRKIAVSDFPVLITGESGTGKELAAKAIHDHSSRRTGPFVPINCGAIPENLVESELFGHEKGAFTGAVQRHHGKAESAQGGTLFLDEIAELPLSAQCKLLRFLQDQTIERIGGSQKIKLDVRIVAATNADLEQAMANRAFREDLYYRLGGVHLSLPALRERGDDALLIGMVFLKRMSEELGKRTAGFTPDAVQALRNHSWPGNIRELQNRIRHAVVMAEQRDITSHDLNLSDKIQKDTPTATLSMKQARQQLETHIVIEALALHHWNLSRTARELGISRPTLYRLLQKHGLCQKH